MESNGHPQPRTGTSIKKRRPSDQAEFSILLKRIRRGFKKQAPAQPADLYGRDKQGGDVAVVEWTAVMDLLDKIVPEWSYAVRGFVPIGEFVAAIAAITIHGVTREGVSIGIGGAELNIKTLEYEALTQAAVKFGIARELYRKNEKGRRAEECKQNDCDLVVLLFDPMAKTESELISSRQLSLIQSLAKRARQDPEILCYDACKARLPEISRRAASTLIEYLRRQILLIS
jgi:hypothetical protein